MPYPMEEKTVELETTKAIELCRRLEKMAQNVRYLLETSSDLLMLLATACAKSEAKKKEKEDHELRHPD